MPTARRPPAHFWTGPDVQGGEDDPLLSVRGIATAVLIGLTLWAIILGIVFLLID
jgi:hypothetical protein